MGWLFRNPDLPRPKTSCPEVVTDLATHPKNKAGPAHSYMNVHSSITFKGIMKIQRDF